MTKRALLISFALLVFMAGFSPAQDGAAPEKTPEARLQEIQRAIEEKGANWTASMNEIFARSGEEKKQYYGSNTSPSLEKIPDSKQVMRYSWQPEKFTWRNIDRRNYITSVKNQGACGSCVAFSVIGTLEGQYNIHHDQSVPYYEQNDLCDFSEQHFLACGEGSCDGWFCNYGFDYLFQNGVPNDSCFPYVSGDEGIDQPCEDGCPDWQEQAVSITCFDYINGNAEPKTPADIKEQLLKGPISVSFTVYEDFDAYDSGIYEHLTGEVTAGHAVVMVGWDDTTNPPCWICKNSWKYGDGTAWGEGGYFRIIMGTNECGIESECIFMTLEDAAIGEISDIGHLYGDVDVGDAEDWNFEIWNIGNIDLEITGFESESPDFTISDPTVFPVNIAPGDTAAFTATFAPDSIGFQYVQFNILSNSCKTMQRLKLRGDGVFHNVKADPQAIEETMEEGTTTTVPMSVLYTGEATLTYHLEVLRDWLSVEPEDGTLETGERVDAIVTFDASSLVPDEYRTNILVQTDDPTDKVVVVPITLTVTQGSVVIVSVAEMTCPLNEIVNLDLFVDNETFLEMPVTALTAHISYDAEFLEVLDILPTSRTEMMSTFQWTQDGPGSLFVSITDDSGGIILPGSEAVASLSFAFREETSCGASTLIDITEATLADTSGLAVEMRLKAGQVMAVCKGDLDIDGVVDVTDIMETVELILHKTCYEEWSPECWAADFNDDGSVDTRDLIGMINLILSE